jgi:alpha-L-rhamnosidase
MASPLIVAAILIFVGLTVWSLAKLSRRRPAFTVTPLAVQQTVVEPAEFVEVAPGRYFADFGRAAFAALELNLPAAAAENGKTLTVHLGETLSAPRVVERHPAVWIRAHSATVHLRRGKTRYLAPLTKADARMMPDGIGPVMPFRYLGLEGAPPGLQASAVRQIMAHYPFDDTAAHFACSDPKINAIWELCKYTIKATSFAGLFVDGDRERKPYEADAYINQLGWYYCAGEFALPRFSHEYLIRHPTWPTEWIMFSVLMAWEDYLFSGETASLKAFYPDLKAKTLLALARPDGLISAPRRLPRSLRRAIHIRRIRDIVDWPAAFRDDYDMRPVNTVVNAFHARALDRMARIAAVLGHVEDERNFRAAAQRAIHSLNAKLSDQDNGLYVDGEGSRHISLHANLFPLAFGLVPEVRRAAVAAYVAGRGMACSVYGAQFLLEALFDNDLAPQALALMTNPNQRSWTHMIESVGTTMTLESWDTKQNRRDWNHAWGAAPANILPRKVMGVTPLEPGFAKVLVRPRPGNLAWAESRTPTRHGPVTIRFDNAQEFRLNLELPPGVTARVGLPLGQLAQRQNDVEVVVDDHKVAFQIDGSAAFVDRIQPGHHEFTLRRESP